MEKHPAFVFFGLAALFFIALFLGRLVAKMRIPRVTGYLLTGLFAGPSFAHLLHVNPILGAAMIEKMRAMSEIALVLILISIGMHFRGEFIRRWRQRIFLFSASEVLATWLLVTLFITTVNILITRHVLTEMGSLESSSAYLGVLLGVLAIATAPAATLLVIREYESEGPLTDAVTTLVGLNNFATIIAFNIVVHFTLMSDAGFLHLILRILVPIGIGCGIGFLMSSWAQKLSTVADYQLVVLGGSLMIMALCKFLNYDFLLACFAAGMVLVNASPKSDEIFKAIKQFDYALYVIFFVIAGASLHLEEIGYIGLLGIMYIVGRILGKLIGTFLGARVGQFSINEQKYTGFTMLAQAGVAIGLCQALVKMEAPGADFFATIVYGSVVIFELIGPVSVRFGLVSAGEVPLLTLLAKRAPSGLFEGLHQVVDYFRGSIGLPKGHQVQSARDILVKHIMRTNVNTIRDNTPFNELLHQIAHSRYDRFPVVDENGRFLGVIDYEDIRDILFEPSLSQLVVAHDLVKKVALVTYENSTLGEVLEFFRKHKNITYLPVVEDLAPEKLIGMVSQNDVLATFRKFNK